MNTLFTLDRFEGNIAVCENRETGEMINIKASKISSNACEGDILYFDGSMYVVDKRATDEAKRELEKLLELNKKFKN